MYPNEESPPLDCSCLVESIQISNGGRYWGSGHYSSSQCAHLELVDNGLERS